MSATGVPVCTPHTGRLSTRTEAEDERLLLGRIGHPALRRRAARTRPSERTGAASALTPFSSVRSPHARRPPITSRASSSSPSASRSVGCRRCAVKPDDRAVDVGAGQRLAPRLAAERQPGELGVHAAAPVQRQLEQPPGERIDAHRVHRHHVGRGHAGHRAARSPSAAARATPSPAPRRCGRWRSAGAGRTRSACAAPRGRRPRPRRRPGPSARPPGSGAGRDRTSRPAPRRRAGRRCTCRRAPTSPPSPAPSPLIPPATTLMRRSRSVRIPNPWAPRSITTAVPGPALISCAASRIDVSGPHTTGSPRTRLPTGSSAVLTAGSRASVCSSVGSSSSDRATNLHPVRRRQQGLGLVGGDPVATRVLHRAGAERRRQPGQQRAVPEHLALAQHVEHLAVGRRARSRRCG